MPASLDDDLRRFGLFALRPAQARAIDAVSAGGDVVVLLPTGGGKSLCYQLPAVRDAEAGRGSTLVVSPLVALMEDQVRALRARGVSAVALHSHLDAAARREAEAALERGPALVYASPERLVGPRFRRRLAALGIARIAVDEAHCVSEWGHDFRPEYRRLAELRDLFDAPVTALTATATPRVLDELVDALGLRAPVVIRESFARENLVLSVELCDGDRARAERTAALVSAEAEVLAGRGRALVYVATRKRARAVAEALRRRGVRADWYHAGRTPGARAAAVERYEAGRAPVLVATTAFGMGMDRPDVRLVVHAEAPGGLEAYAQQAGRAGRDGAAARCVLLWSSKDAVTQGLLRGSTPRPGALASWRALEAYATGAGCREVALTAWFGEPRAPCGRCDACTGAPRVLAAADAWTEKRESAARARRERARADAAVQLDAAQRELVIAFVAALKRPVGKRLVALGLRGSRAKVAARRGIPENPHRGALAGVPEEAITRAVDELLAEGRLARKGRKYPTVWLPDKPVRAAAPARRRPARGALEQALRAFRTAAARRRRWKPYQVFPDATLRALVESRPRTLEELARIPGIGPARIERFGDELLRILGASAPG